MTPIEREAPRKNGRKAATAAAVAAAGAVACGICCVLPFALPAAALAGSGGLLAWLGGAQGWAPLLAVALVASAWLWVAVRSAQSKRRPARSTLLVLGLATLLLVAALAWPLFEGQLIVLLRS
jgi:hypothetical protein